MDLEEPRRGPGAARPTAAIEIFATQAARIAMKVHGKAASAVVFDARPRWYLCGSIQIEDTVDLARLGSAAHRPAVAMPTPFRG